MIALHRIAKMSSECRATTQLGEEAEGFYGRGRGSLPKINERKEEGKQGEVHSLGVASTRSLDGDRGESPFVTVFDS